MLTPLFSEKAGTGYGLAVCEYQKRAAPVGEDPGRPCPPIKTGPPGAADAGRTRKERRILICVILSQRGIAVNDAL